MKQYRVGYYESDSGFIYFEAEDEAKAKEIYENLKDGAINLNDIEADNNGFQKSLNSDYDILDMEEVKR